MLACIGIVFICLEEFHRFSGSDDDGDKMTIDGTGLWQRDNVWSSLYRRIVVGGAAKVQNIAIPFPYIIV